MRLLSEPPVWRLLFLFTVFMLMNYGCLYQIIEIMSSKNINNTLKIFH